MDGDATPPKKDTIRNWASVLGSSALSTHAQPSNGSSGLRADLCPAQGFSNRSGTERTGRQHVGESHEASHAGCAGGGRSHAAAGLMSLDNLLAQARRSVFNLAFGKVHCRACGQAFPSYTRLAQHIGSKHDGVNSEDVKYLQLHRLTAAAASAADTDMRNCVQASSSRNASPSATLSTKKSSSPVTFADLLSRHSSKQGVIKTHSLPGASHLAQSAQPIPGQTSPGSTPASTNVSQAPRHLGTQARRFKGTTITFGTMLRAPVRHTPAGAHASGKRAAVSGRQGARVRTAMFAKVPQGRRRLRAEGAETRKRQSRTKRIVVQQRAGKALAKAHKECADAQTALNNLATHRTRLINELSEAAMEAGVKLEGGPGAVPAAGPSAHGSNSAALSNTSLLPPEMPARVRMAVLQLSMGKVAAQVAQAQAALKRAEARMAAAVKQHIKAFNLPDADAAAEPEHLLPTEDQPDLACVPAEAATPAMASSLPSSSAAAVVVEEPHATQDMDGAGGSMPEGLEGCAGSSQHTGQEQGTSSCLQPPPAPAPAPPPPMLNGARIPAKALARMAAPPTFKDLLGGGVRGDESSDFDSGDSEWEEVDGPGATTLFGSLTLSMGTSDKPPTTDSNATTTTVSWPHGTPPVPLPRVPLLSPPGQLDGKGTHHDEGRSATSAAVATAALQLLGHTADATTGARVVGGRDTLGPRDTEVAFPHGWSVNQRAHGQQAPVLPGALQVEPSSGPDIAAFVSALNVLQNTAPTADSGGDSGSEGAGDSQGLGSDVLRRWMAQAALPASVQNLHPHLHTLPKPPVPDPQAQVVAHAPARPQAHLPHPAHQSPVPPAATNGKDVGGGDVGGPGGGLVKVVRASRPPQPTGASGVQPMVHLGSSGPALSTRSSMHTMEMGLGGGELHRQSAPAFPGPAAHPASVNTAMPLSYQSLSDFTGNAQARTLSSGQGSMFSVGGVHGGNSSNSQPQVGMTGDGVAGGSVQQVPPNYNPSNLARTFSVDAGRAMHGSHSHGVSLGMGMGGLQPRPLQQQGLPLPHTRMVPGNSWQTHLNSRMYASSTPNVHSMHLLSSESGNFLQQQRPDVLHALMQQQQGQHALAQLNLLPGNNYEYGMEAPAADAQPRRRISRALLAASLSRSAHLDHAVSLMLQPGAGASPAAAVGQQMQQMGGLGFAPDAGGVGFDDTGRLGLVSVSRGQLPVHQLHTQGGPSVGQLGPGVGGGSGSDMGALPSLSLPRAPVSDDLGCAVCGVRCNSAAALEQHMASKKHLARIARQGLEALDNAALEAGVIPHTGGNGAGAAPATFTGLGAPCHQLCRQIISPDLNQVVAELLLKIKGFQDRAMLRDPMKAAAHRWYVCGLREVRKVVRGKRARSVVIAPNIESVSADGGLDDHLKEIISMCSEQGVSVVFALTRKKMGELYGYRKRVSAVAVLEFNGADGLHVRMLQLAVAGRREWEEAQREGLLPLPEQQTVVDVSDGEAEASQPRSSLSSLAVPSQPEGEVGDGDRGRGFLAGMEGGQPHSIMLKHVARLQAQQATQRSQALAQAGQAQRAQAQAHAEQAQRQLQAHQHQQHRYLHQLQLLHHHQQQQQQQQQLQQQHLQQQQQSSYHQHLQHLHSQRLMPASTGHYPEFDHMQLQARQLPAGFPQGLMARSADSVSLGLTGGYPPPGTMYYPGGGQY